MYGFREVWFPDGVIRWFAEVTPGPLPYLTPAEVADVIRPTMAYMSERLPLDIQEVDDSSDSNLMFKKSSWDGLAGIPPLLGGQPQSGAWTFGYWAPAGNPKDIAYYGPGRVSIVLTAHEFGHALGMPHEHQQLDRSGLQFHPEFPCPEPFNHGQTFFNTNVRYHSPYDVSSRMMYRNDCVQIITTIGPQVAPQPRYGGTTALYSPDDINSVYRVYGHALGTNNPDDLFGHAVAILDLDDDGFEDIVIAANDETSANSRRLNLYFFRGVRTDPSELGSGRRYVPWFVYPVRDDLPNTPATRSYRLALAPGDFNGDERMELAVGYPANDAERRVRIFGQAQPAAFPTGLGAEPWGVKGLRLLQEIAPSDIAPGYSGKETFAQTLQVGRLTNSNRDDLLIGWPSAHRAARSPSGAEIGWFGRWGAVVHLRTSGGGGGDLLDVSAATLIANPSYSKESRFGSAITVLLNTIDGLDTMVVGAPGERTGIGGIIFLGEPAGRVYIYGGTSLTNGAPRVPPVLATLNGQPNSDFGHALGSIRVAGSTDRGKTHSIVVGAPRERYIMNAQRIMSVGAVYHYGIEFRTQTEAVVMQLGRLIAPDARRGVGMQWGYALAVIQEGSSYAGVQVGIGAPGTHDGGFVYAWRPFTPIGDFSTSGWSLPTPAGSGRFGEVLRAIGFRSGETERRGFAIGAPIGMSGGVTAGFVQAQIDQNALTTGSWNPDDQVIRQRTTGDHPPDNL